MSLTGFLGTMVGAAACGVAGYFFLGKMLKIKALWAGLLTFLAVGLIFGAINLSSMSVGSVATPQTSLSATEIGSLSVELSNGVANNDTGADYYSDDKMFLTQYIDDDDVEDGQNVNHTATLTRTLVKEAAAVTVECTIADKELSGVTADNLAEKNSGQVDLWINGGQTFVNDNTVKQPVTFAAGTATSAVKVEIDQEETYEDGFTAYDDYSDIVCKAYDQTGVTISWTERVYARD